MHTGQIVPEKSPKIAKTPIRARKTTQLAAREAERDGKRSTRCPTP
jgi:hypothetical protein